MMSRNLMALAVAGAFAAPALAATSTVQIYGRVTMEYGYADQGAGRPNTDIFQTPGGSSVGVRGEEKLGGGLSAWFQCESSADVRGINQDGFCSRNSAIGLKGSWGNLHFGRWDTPFKRAMPGLQGAEGTGLFGSNFVFSGGSTSTVTQGGQGASPRLQRALWRRREAGLLYYESPNFSGFQVLAAFTPANATAVTNATTGAKPRVQSLGATYRNGPLRVGLGYERHNNFAAVGGGNDDRAWTLGASYTFMGKVTVGAQYLDQKYETSATTELKKKNWQVGVEWNIAGPHNIDAAYVKAGDSKGPAGANANLGGGYIPIAMAAGGTGADWWSLSYRHNLSKRTMVRVGYVRLSNDANSFYALGGLRAPTIGGENQSAWALFARHNW